MANTFTCLHVHVVFSPKNRERWLTPDVEEDVWRYPGGICRAHKFTALQIGGVDDHVHLLPGCPATVALSDFIRRLQGAGTCGSRSYAQGIRTATSLCAVARP